MKINKPITAEELASILAVWAVALIGCKNVAASALEKYFPQYFSELLKPDSPMFGISASVVVCIVVTAGVSFLLFGMYDNFVKKINDAEAFICKIIKKNVPLLKEILMMALCFIVVLIAMLFNKDFSSVFIFYVCFCIYPSKNFSYLAKMAIIPALLLILVAFLLPSGKYNKQEPYIVSTTCEGLKEIEVKSAIRVGNFVELTTETGPVLININTITRIREIKKSPEDAVKTPPPAAQK